MNIVEISFGFMTEFFLKPGIESSLRSIALASMGTRKLIYTLGNVFVSNPSLLLSEVSQKIMRQILQQDYAEFQKDLLKIFILLLRNDQLQVKGIVA